MTVLVVGRLELIDVENGDREGGVRVVLGRHPALDHFAEGAPVGQARERVHPCLCPEEKLFLFDNHRKNEDDGGNRAKQGDQQVYLGEIVLEGEGQRAVVGGIGIDGVVGAAGGQYERGHPVQARGIEVVPVAGETQQGDPEEETSERKLNGDNAGGGVFRKRRIGTQGQPQDSRKSCQHKVRFPLEEQADCHACETDQKMCQRPDADAGSIGFKPAGKQTPDEEEQDPSRKMHDRDGDQQCGCIDWHTALPPSRLSGQPHRAE